MAELLKRFGRNTAGRDFVVGDIHGMFHVLQRALDAVQFDGERDRLFSVGDLIDRGPASHECLAWLEKPWFHAVRGNHEEMAIQAFNDQARVALHAINGGIWFAALDRCEQAPFADAFCDLPFAIEVETEQGTIGIVHAECPTDNWQDFIASLMDRHTLDMAVWSRRRIENAEREPQYIEGITAVISGHTILDKPCASGNHLFIDLGAYKKNGELCLVELCKPLTPHITRSNPEQAAA